MSYTAQITDLSSIFFDKRADITDAERAELVDDNAKTVIDAVAKNLAALPTWSAYFINQAVYQVRVATGVKGRKLYMPIRIAATLHMHGPQLAETMELIGRDEVMANIKKVQAGL